MESLVSINVWEKEDDKAVLYNTNNIPILFYANGDEDITDDLKASEVFKNFLNDKHIFENPKTYLNTFVSYFYFNYESGEEKYTDNTVSVKDLYGLEIITANIILESFQYLYNKSFGHQFVSKSLWEIEIKEMYSAIKGKYQEKISGETFKNACRGYIQGKYKELSLSEVDVLVNKIISIIFEK